ncbi:MAG: Plus agglutinin, partial [Microgenomates group bacterium GW2011_GWA2_46_7]
MPDTLNKQALINLLIDSPLREPIKINLIDIVNNTTEPDLPKVFPTITKELEIFQKATDRRMKLADEAITKLSGTAPAPESMPLPPAPSAPTPPLDLPPLPNPPTPLHIESDSSREMTPDAEQSGSPSPDIIVVSPSLSIDPSPIASDTPTPVPTTVPTNPPAPADSSPAPPDSNSTIVTTDPQVAESSAELVSVESQPIEKITLANGQP